MMIDADGAVAGRLGVIAAKALLKGETVVVVNAERSVISGSPANTIAKYAARRAVIQKANPQNAPHWPRRPDMLLRRIIRGMLPFDQAKGREAFKKLRVYMGVPEEVKNQKFEKMEQKVLPKFIVLSDLCKRLGWNG